MANSLLTINMITNEAVRLWENTNSFIQNINRQYDNSFAQSGAKIGTQLRVRYPNDYVVNDGPAISIQDTTEQSTTLTVATQKNIAVSFNTVDLTMSLDNYSEIVLAPQINNLAGKVAAIVMGGGSGTFDGTGVAESVCNLVFNPDGAGNPMSPTVFTYLQAKAVLSNASAPAGNWKIANDPTTEANVVTTASGLLNPNAAISKQYRTGQMWNAVGFDWMSDQTIISHTTGTFSAGTVAGANQTGTTLLVNATTGTLRIGDIITIQGVNQVNAITKVSKGTLRQFVVTANAISGATSISIFPSIVPASNGSDVQYQTVDVSPAAGATISLVMPASSVFRKNLAFAPDSVTMVTADLVMPDNVKVARANYDGVSLRMIQQYIALTDQNVQRLDVLFGYLLVRPQWAVAIADPV